MAEFKKSTALTVGILLVVLFSICRPLDGWAGPITVKSIRTGSQQTYVRMVIETDGRLSPRPTVDINGTILTLTLSGARNGSAVLNSEAYRDDVSSIDVAADSTGVAMKATLTFPPSRVRTFFLKGPHRFVIDAYRPSAEKAAPPPADAIQPISIIDAQGDQAGKTIITEKASTATPDEKKANMFQRHLLLFLIGITTMLLVTLLFLMTRSKN